MWTLGLLKTMKDPKYVVYQDQKVVMIKDMYPKARHHFLVISNEDIAGVRNLHEKHIPLLEHMQKKAKEYVDKNVPGVVFRYGYHAQPSMHRLHLHVISNDMISYAMKTKKHWNSFTTEFFIRSSDVLNQLKSTGKIKLPTNSECEEILKKDLQCHICSSVLSNIPKLKAHILIHDK